MRGQKKREGETEQNAIRDGRTKKKKLSGTENNIMYRSEKEHE
jgi:hypothetical protein